MDARLSAAPVLAEFGALVKTWVPLQALYVGGSLAGGDYRPGVSDLDVTAIVTGQLGGVDRRRLEQRHVQLEERCRSTAALHCIYVDANRLSDAGAEHPMWSDRRIRDRPLSALARIELVRLAVTLYGPSPDTFFGEPDAAALRSAARAELTGYWQSAVAKPSLWLSDWCVDLGLVTIARADAAIHEDCLITKREAIDRLGRYGVPEALVHEIRLRRDGKSRDQSLVHRARRGRIARRLVARRIAELSELH